MATCWGACASRGTALSVSVVLLVAGVVNGFSLPSSSLERLHTSPLGVTHELIASIPSLELHVPESEIQQASAATSMDALLAKGVAMQYGYNIPLQDYNFYAQATRVALDKGHLYLLRIRSP